MSGTASYSDISTIIKGFKSFEAGEVLSGLGQAEILSSAGIDSSGIRPEPTAEFHLMLMEEDIRRISYLGKSRGILTLSSASPDTGGAKLRLWSCPKESEPGSHSPPKVLEELSFEKVPECLAVSPNGSLVAVVVDGLLGLYEINREGEQGNLVQRASRMVRSIADGSAEISFGVDGRNLRFTSPEGETKLLCLGKEGPGLLGDVLEGW